MTQQLDALNMKLSFLTSSVTAMMLGMALFAQPAAATDEVAMLKLSSKSSSSLEKKCKRDKAPECAALAMRFIEGEDDAPNAAKAFESSKKSCELNFARGCTIYGAMVSGGMGQDPEVAEYFYSACALGDMQGCNLTLAYAYGRDHSLKGRGRRVEVARKTCQVGNPAGCDLLEDLGAKHMLITDPARMNTAELQWYVGNTLDYVGAARVIVARYPDGTGVFGKSNSDAEYLGELIVDIGSEGMKKMDDRFVKIVGSKKFWRNNNEASKIATGEWGRRRYVAFTEKRQKQLAREAQRARSRGSSSSSSSGSSSSPYTAPTSGSQSQPAKVCYWVTNSGIGGGRYRKCD